LPFDAWCKGILIEARRSELERFPVIKLQGSADFKELSKTPAVIAYVESSSNTVPIPATFRPAGNRYEILIDTSTIRPLPGDVVRIRLQFDTFFVRKDAAPHNDFRQLVSRPSTRCEAVAKETLTDGKRDQMRMNLGVRFRVTSRVFGYAYFADEHAF
jgi:hypothetical protein